MPEVLMPIRMPVSADTRNATSNFRALGNEADKTAKLVVKISNAAVTFSKIVGQSAHAAQQSYQQTENRLRLLMRSLDSASTSARALAQNLNALGKITTSDAGISKFTHLNTTLKNSTTAAAAGSAAMSNFGEAARIAGKTGAAAMASLSAETVTAIAGIATLTRFMQSATQQMERMDILRASYQRIMGARPDMTNAESLNNAVSDFWIHSKELAYQYGVAIDDVAGTMIEFARQGHSPSTVQYLTKELAELRLMLATSTGNLEDMRSAMGSVITLMNQTGASAVEAVDGLKLMAEYDIRTATSFSKMSDALNRFAAAGRVAGMTMPEMVKVSAAFTEIGIQGNRAGTALNSIIARVANTKKARAFLEELGIGMTTLENGAVRAMSTFERLVEAYKVVKATGNKELLQRFGDVMAGTRMQSVLYAGLEQYIKQTQPQVTSAQLRQITQRFGSELKAAFNRMDIEANPKINLSSQNILMDKDEVRQKLLANVQPLMQDFIKEFEAKGSVSMPSDISLMKRLLGLDSSQDALHLIAVYSDTFRTIKSMFDSFFASIESNYNNVERLALSTSEEMARKREEALDIMRNTIQNQYKRAQNAFQEAFLSDSAISKYKTVVEFSVGMFETMGKTIAGITSNPLSFLSSIPGVGQLLSPIVSFTDSLVDSRKAVLGLGIAIESYLGVQLLNILGSLKDAGMSVFHSITGGIGRGILSIGEGVGQLQNLVTNFGDTMRAISGRGPALEPPAWVDQLTILLGSSADRVSIWNRLLGIDDMSKFEVMPSLIDNFNAAMAKTQMSSDAFARLSEAVAETTSRMDGLILPSERVLDSALKTQEVAEQASNAWVQYSNALSATANSLELIKAAYGGNVAKDSIVSPLDIRHADYAEAAKSTIEHEKLLEEEHARLIQQQDRAIDGFRRMAEAALKASDDMLKAARSVNDVLAFPTKANTIPNTASQVLNSMQYLPKYLQEDVVETKGKIFSEKGINTLWLGRFGQQIDQIKSDANALKDVQKQINDAQKEIEASKTLLKNGMDSMDLAEGRIEGRMKSHADTTALILQATEIRNRLGARGHRKLYAEEEKIFDDAIETLEKFKDSGTSMEQVGKYIDHIADRLRHMDDIAASNELKKLFDPLNKGAETFESTIERIEKALVQIKEYGSFNVSKNRVPNQEVLTDNGKRAYVPDMRSATEVLSQRPDRSNDAAKLMLTTLEDAIPLVEVLTELKEKGANYDWKDAENLKRVQNINTDLVNSYKQAKILAADIRKEFEATARTSPDYLTLKEAAANADARVSQLRKAILPFALGVRHKDLYAGEVDYFEQLGVNMQDRLAPHITKITDETRTMLEELVKTDASSGERIGRLADVYRQLKERAEEYRKTLSDPKAASAFNETQFKELRQGEAYYNQLADNAEKMMDRITLALQRGHGNPTIFATARAELDGLLEALKTMPTVKNAASGTNFAKLLADATHVDMSNEKNREGLSKAYSQLGESLKEYSILAEQARKKLEDNKLPDMAKMTPEEEASWEARLSTYDKVIARLEQLRATASMGLVPGGRITKGDYATVTSEADMYSSRLSAGYTHTVTDVEKQFLENMINGNERLGGAINAGSIESQIAKQKDLIDSLSLSLKKMNAEQMDALVHEQPLPYKEKDIQTIWDSIDALDNLNKRLESLKTNMQLMTNLGKSKEGEIYDVVKQRATLAREGDQLAEQAAGLRAVTKTPEQQEAIERSIKKLEFLEKQVKSVSANANDFAEAMNVDIGSLDKLGITSEKTADKIEKTKKALQSLSKSNVMMQSDYDTAIADTKALREQTLPGIREMHSAGFRTASPESINALKGSVTDIKRDMGELNELTDKFRKSFYAIKGNPEAQALLRDLGGKTKELNTWTADLVAKIEAIDPAADNAAAKVKELQDELARFKEAKKAADDVATSLYALVGNKIMAGVNALKGAVDTVVGKVMSIYSWFMRLNMVVNIASGLMKQIRDFMEDTATSASKITAEFEEQARLKKVIDEDRNRATKHKEDTETIFGQFRDSLSTIQSNLPMLEQLSIETGLSEATLLKAFDSYRKYTEEYWHKADEFAKEGKNIFEDSTYTFQTLADYLGRTLGVRGEAYEKIADYLRASQNFDISGRTDSILGAKRTQIEQYLDLRNSTKRLEEVFSKTIDDVQRNLKDAFTTAFDNALAPYKNKKMSGYIGTEGLSEAELNTKAYTDFREPLQKMAARPDLESLVKSLNDILTDMYSENGEKLDIFTASAEQLGEAFAALLKQSENAPNRIQQIADALRALEEAGMQLEYVKTIVGQIESAKKAGQDIQSNKTEMGNLSTYVDRATPELRTSSKIRMYEQKFDEINAREEELKQKKADIDILDAGGHKKEAEAERKKYIEELKKVYADRKKNLEEYSKAIREAEQEASAEYIRSLMDVGLPKDVETWSQLHDELVGMLDTLKGVDGQPLDPAKITEFKDSIAKYEQDIQTAYATYTEDMKAVVEVDKQVAENNEKIKAIQAEKAEYLKKVYDDGLEVDQKTIDGFAKNIATLEEDSEKLLASVEEQRAKATTKFQAALDNAQAGLQKVIDALFAGVDEAGRKLIVELMNRYNIHIDAWNKVNPGIKLDGIKLDEGLLKQTPGADFKQPQPAAPKPAPTNKEEAKQQAEAERRTQDRAANLYRTVSKAVEGMSTVLKSWLSREKKETNNNRGTNNDINSATKSSAKANKGSSGSKKDPNKDALSELLNNFSEEAADLKIAFQTIQDTEGNIVKYLDRTKSHEYLAEQVALLKKQEAELKEFLSRPNLSNEVRRRAQKALRDLQLKSVKLELDIELKNWEERKGQMQEVIKSLRAVAELPIDFYPDNIKVKKLEERYALTQKIWELETALFDEEYKRAVESGDAINIQKMAFQRFNDVLKQTKGLFSDIEEKLKIIMEKTAKESFGTFDMFSENLEAMRKADQEWEDKLFEDPYAIEKIENTTVKKMERAADKYSAATAAAKKLMNEYIRKNPSYFGNLGGMDPLTRGYTSIMKEFGKLSGAFASASTRVNVEVTKLKGQLEVEKKRLESMYAGKEQLQGVWQAELDTLNETFENRVDKLYQDAWDITFKELERRIDEIKLPSLTNSTPLNLDRFAKAAGVLTPVDRWIKEKTDERIQQMKKAGIIGSDEEIAAAAKKIREELKPQAAQLKKEGIMDSYRTILPTTQRNLEMFYRQTQVMAAEYYKQNLDKNYRTMMQQMGIKEDDPRAAQVMEMAKERTKQAASAMANKLNEWAEEQFERIRSIIRDTFKESWEEGFEIGYEYGFSHEGMEKLVENLKKKFAKNLSDILYNQVHSFIENALYTINDTIINAATDAAGKGKSETGAKAVAVLQDFIAPLFSGIIGSLMGMLVGSIFSDFTSEIEKEAEAQLKQQRDSINAQGFSWSYGKDNASTPYYEFSPPVTQESVKVVKFSSTFNITTDAAMAMASHRRELERVCAEIIEAYNRNAAKTVGANI